MRKKKNMLITGASTGIGAATAVLAAKNGYNIGIHYNSDEKGARLVSQLCEDEGAITNIFQGDVAKPDDISRVFTEFDAAFPSLDVFVNNAGIVDQPSRVDEMSHARLRRMFDVNLIGAFLAAQEAVLRMSSSYGGEGGAIVNISSAAARLGAANQYVDYAASKAGIDIMTTGLAQEVANEGVRVNAVRPGIIETAIHAKGGQPDRCDDMAPLVPMQRSGSAEEVAHGILWLCSEGASYVTGTHLDITGGR